MNSSRTGVTLALAICLALSANAAPLGAPPVPAPSLEDIMAASAPRDALLLARARAAVREDAPDRARAAYAELIEQAETSPQIERAARREFIDILVESQRFQQARQLATQDYLDQVGDRERARVQLVLAADSEERLAIARQHPALIDADRLLRSYQDAFSVSELRDIAERSYVQDNYGLAATFWEQVPTADLSPLDRERLGRSWFANRKYDRALEVLAPLLDSTAMAERRAAALYYSGRMLLRQNKAEEGTALLQRLVETDPESQWIDNALWILGRYWLRVDNERARTAFRHLYKSYPDSDYAAQSRWYAAWCNYYDGHRNQFARQAERIRTILPPESTEYRQASFWLARMALDDGRQRQAQQLLRELIEHSRQPDYYLVRASELLQNPALVGNVVQQLEQTPAPENPQQALTLRRIQTLMQLDLVDIAYAEAGELLREYSGAQRSQVARQLAAVGAYTPALRTLGRTDAASYPLAFQPHMEEAARIAELDPYLGWAIMREESAFDPQGTSWVGAMGLMQLMPATARNESRRLGLDLAEPRQAYQIALNIRLGTSYLARMIRYQGKPYLAIASYNGGPGNVDRWEKRFGTDDQDWFIENIPFDETNAYVKKVLTSYALYRKLHQD